jgi:hypothetical protein
MSTEITGVAAAPPAAPTGPAPNNVAAERSGGAISMWRDESGPAFGDLLDAINPLQHIPIISSLYRAITGDQIGHIPRVIGDALFGGPVGLLLAGVHGMIKEASGAEPSEHVVALFRDLTGPEETAVATTEPATGESSPMPTAGSNPAVAAAGPVSPAAYARPPGKVQAAGAPSHTIRAGDMERERRRIAAAVFEAQRAQSQLLFSSVGLPPAAESRKEGVENAEPAPHPNVRPADSSSDWIARAMERGLAKYQAARRAESASAVDTLE